MNKLIPRVFALFCFGVLGSCTYDNAEDLYNKFPEPCDVSAVSYSMDIKIIIEQNCAFSGCHGGSAPAAGHDWSIYSEVAANKDKIKDRINRPVGAPGHMPKGGSLTQCEIDQISAWIDMGALNN